MKWGISLQAVDPQPGVAFTLERARPGLPIAPFFQILHRAEARVVRLVMWPGEAAAEAPGCLFTAETLQSLIARSAATRSPAVRDRVAAFWQEVVLRVRLAGVPASRLAWAISIWRIALLQRIRP